MFSIGLISAGLTLFYTTSLSGLTTRRRSLPGFIGSFLRAPRFLKPVKLGKDQGHCYIAEVDVDTIDTRDGLSPFVVLENGAPLPGFPANPMQAADQRSLQNVRDHGMGRHIHIGRHVFFSPRDNAEPMGRTYLLLETLTLDSGKVKALLALSDRAAMGNSGIWLLTKLKIYAGAMLGLGGFEDVAPESVTLRDVQLDLSQYGLPQLQCARATIRWTEQPATVWNHVEIDLRGMVSPGLPQDAWLTGRIGYSADCRIRLEQLTLGHGDETWLRSRLDWAEEDGGLRNGEIACNDVTPLRQGLTDACGSAEMQQHWIASFIDAIQTGALPLGGQLDAAAAARLTDAFAPDGTARAITLRLQRGDDGAIAITCPPAGETA